MIDVFLLFAKSLNIRGLGVKPFDNLSECLDICLLAGRNIFVTGDPDVQAKQSGVCSNVVMGEAMEEEPASPVVTFLNRPRAPVSRGSGSASRGIPRMGAGAIRPRPPNAVARFSSPWVGFSVAAADFGVSPPRSPRPIRPHTSIVGPLVCVTPGCRRFGKTCGTARHTLLAPSAAATLPSCSAAVQGILAEAASQHASSATVQSILKEADYTYSAFGVVSRPDPPQTPLPQPIPSANYDCRAKLVRQGGQLSQLVWTAKSPGSPMSPIKAQFELELLSTDNKDVPVDGVSSTADDLPPSSFTVEKGDVVTGGSTAHCRRMGVLIRATGSTALAISDFVRCLAACGFVFQNGRAEHTHDASGLSTRERMYPALHEAVYGALVDSHGTAIANGYLQGPLWMSSDGRPVRSCHLEAGVMIPDGSPIWDWVPRDPVAACCDGLPLFTGCLVIDEPKPSMSPAPSITCIEETPPTSLERASAVVDAVVNNVGKDLFPSQS